MIAITINYAIYNRYRLIYIISHSSVHDLLASDLERRPFNETDILVTIDE